MHLLYVFLTTLPEAISIHIKKIPFAQRPSLTQILQMYLENFRPSISTLYAFCLWTKLVPQLHNNRMKPKVFGLNRVGMIRSCYGYQKY